jgi:hypothetical protein
MAFKQLQNRRLQAARLKPTRAYAPGVITAVFGGFVMGKLHGKGSRPNILYSPWLKAFAVGQEQPALKRLDFNRTPYVAYARGFVHAAQLG